MKIIDDITQFIFVENEPTNADIIFIPGTSVAEPAERAAKLWYDGYAPYIMPSGKYSLKLGRFPSDRTKSTPYEGKYETECDFFGEVLGRNDVPKTAVIEERNSTNTKENAFKSRELTERLGMKIQKAIVCCQAYHGRRALMTYSWAYPEVEFYICPVETRSITKKTWFTFEYGIERVMGELSRCGTYFPKVVEKMYSLKRGIEPVNE